MKLVCPNCQYAGRMVEFANETDARHFMTLAFSTPAPLANLLLQYLQLFRPAKQVLRWDRARKLLAPLVADIQRAEIERHGRAWSATQPAWKGALEAVLERRDQLTLPLKDHGYLYEVLARQADQVEAKAEREVEERRKRPRPINTQPDEEPITRGMPAEVKAAFAQLTGKLKGNANHSTKPE